MAADVFGWLAAVLTTLFAWPQAVRALRATSTEGVSLASTGLLFASGLLWTLYGVRAPSPYIAVANASVASAALLTAYACRARLRPAMAAAGLAACGAVLTVGALAGQPATGLMGDVVAGSMAVPQAVRALRADASLTAVSPMTYGLLALNAACWIAYGAAIGDALVVAPNLVTLPASVLVLVRRTRAARAERERETGSGK
ncbi:MAG: PQ-loop domain-containing transporter [Myxococcota bacterium]